MTAMGDDMTLTKCAGGTAMSLKTNNTVEVSCATQFSAAETEPAAGGRLTSVQVYLKKTNMTKLVVWVKRGVNDSEVLSSVDITKSKVVGWNKVVLDTPVDIIEGEPLSLGYTYEQDNADPSCITTCDRTSEGGLYFTLNRGNLDPNTMFGNLFIEGSVTLGSIESTNVSVTDIAVESSFYLTKKKPSATIGLKNLGKHCDKVTLRLTCGEKSTDTDVNVNMDYYATKTVRAPFYTPDALTFGAEVKATVVAIDGEPYKGNSRTATFDTYEKKYDRTVVIEEGTGTWCGWCVRGIVAMEEMGKKYPDTFIGIAVHTSSTSVNEPMNIEGYASSIGINGFPGCTVDRLPALKGVDVSPSAFESYYQSERNRATYADFEFDAYINESGKIAGEVNMTFDFDRADRTILMYYVLTEDGVTGYTQANYYADNANGPMGGFENKPKYTDDVVYNEVARKVYPTMSGRTITKSIVKGKQYSTTLNYALPTNIVNKANLRLAALMVDKESGEIINAHQVKLVERGDGINGVSATNADDNRWYRIDGCVTTAPVKGGLYIHNGRKVVVR